jgi:oligopeptide transport system substrate-binding protein
MMKALLVLGWLIIMIASIPAACCGSSSTSPATGQLSDPQILTVYLPGEPDQIDPNLASWGAERSVISQVFQGLLGFDKDLNLIPVISTAIPSVSNGGISGDGKTYTFKLKNFTTWSDGERVTANDFVYSIKRMLDPTLAAAYASFYYDIVGAQSYNEAAGKDAATLGDLKNAVAVTAPDDTTLIITLTQPRPSFLSLMALWPVYPLRQDIIEKYGSRWTEPGNYIGDGPFIMTEWVHQDHITFKPNPNYWGSKPLLTKITCKIITDTNAALAAYMNGELDMSGVPAGTEKAIMADPSLSSQIVRFADLTTLVFAFNVHTYPYDNITLRKALATAIDRASFVDKIRGGVGKVALSWIPPGMPGYDPTLGTEYSFNISKAKTLLAQALRELGLSDASKLVLRFQYANTAGSKNTAEFLQAQLKDNLGIDLLLEPMEPKAFAQLVNSKQHTWAWFGWGADYPDPDNWLPEIFGSGATNNKTSYSNPQFDALATQAKHELDNTKRMQLWAQAQAIVMADAPIITVFYNERFFLLKPYVKGFIYTAMDGQIAGDQYWTNIYIQK